MQKTNKPFGVFFERFNSLTVKMGDQEKAGGLHGL